MATDPTSLRRAVSAAQAVLRESSPSLVVDGKPGTFTLKVYNDAGPSQRDAVDKLMAALGVVGSMVAANKQYVEETQRAVQTPSDPGSKKVIFDLQVVPAVVRQARSRGLNPVSFVTQLCLESGYGAHAPLSEDGSPSFNYAGIKWDAVKTAKKAVAQTREFIGGAWTTTGATFASFANADDFAKGYLDYLLTGPSSYRYKAGYKGSKGILAAQSPIEFGTALLIGGYATDPNYPQKFASTAAAVSKTYGIG